MKLLICMSLVCAACGAPFTYSSADEALAEDAGDTFDAVTTLDALDAAPVVDSGHGVVDAADAAALDVVTDAAPPIDAAPIVDSAPFVDSAPTCTPFPIGSEGTCAVGGSTEFYAIPSQMCETWDGIRTTPAACSDCQEHYTCACLVANVTCAGNPVSCALVNGNPTLSCQ